MDQLIIILALLAVSDDPRQAAEPNGAEPAKTARSEKAADRKEPLEDRLPMIEAIAGNPYASDKDRLRFEQLVYAATNDFPGEPIVWYWRGDLAERMGDWTGAIQYWEKVQKTKSKRPGVQDAPIWARACQRLGYLYLGRDDGAKAEAYARRSLELAPADPRGCQLLLDASLRTGKVYETIEILRAAADKHGGADPTFVSLYYDVLAQVGDWTTLRSQIDQRLRRDPKSQDAHHYLGILAELDGDQLAAFVHHFLAMQDGGADLPTTRKSREYVDRQVQKDDRDLTGRFGTLVKAYFSAERKQSAPQTMQMLNGFKPGNDDERLLVDHLRALALAALGKPEQAMTVWKAVLARQPKYVPALCLYGELLEAGGKFAAAEKLFDQAAKLRPTNWKVRQLVRLGGKFRVVDDGVEVVAVAKHSPLDRFGLKAGDVVTYLDGDALRDLPPHERLLTMRLFQGGKIAYRTKDGGQFTDQVELVLFPY